MAKNKLGPVVEAMAQARTKQLVAEQTKARLCMGMDAAILAAHEVFGLGPGRAAAFRDAYVSSMEELAELFIQDADQHGDDRLEYAKAKRDEAIRRIVGDELFVPFEQAYGAAYMDELKRVRILQEDGND
jgi:hypothetical protein